jgi:exonuclease III
MDINPQTRAPDADLGVESTRGETPPEIRKYNQIHPISQRRDTDRRFVIFNVGDVEVPAARHELEKMLTPEAYSAIVSLRPISNPHSQRRFEMTVTVELGEALKRMLRRRTNERTAYFIRLLRNGGLLRNGVRTDIVMSRWRMVAWKPYFERPHPTDLPVMNQPAKPLGKALLSLNVNGFHKKRIQVEDMIRTESPMVVSLQETLSAERHYPVVVRGFKTFAKPWQKEFRGNALLVDNKLASYELPHDDSKHLIHVKITGHRELPGPMHVFGTYLPSGGNYRRERTRLLKVLNDRVTTILNVEKTAIIICLGDLNIPGAELTARLANSNSKLRVNKVSGSPWTRFPAKRGSKPSNIDHFLVNQIGNNCTGQTKVLRQYPISDHRPIVLRLREGVPQAAETEFVVPRTVFKTGPCKMNGESLVSHNRWAVLDAEPGEVLDNVDLSTAASHFQETFDIATRSVGVKVYTGEGKDRLPRNVWKSLQIYKKLGAKVARLRTLNKRVTEDLSEKLNKAKSRFKELKRTFELRRKGDIYARIADSFATHDHKSVWSQIKTVTGGGTGGDSLHPVRDSAGELKTNPRDILDVHKEHYRSLLQYDPEKRAMDEEYWRSKSLHNERVEEELKGINDPISWPEILLSIRGMKRNTAPGGDGVHVNVMKQMVREECMGEIKQRNPEFVRPEYTMVDLPEDRLPTQPTTRMGAALYRLIKAAWTQEKVPPQWEELHLVSLLKPSGVTAVAGVSPESVESYRGLTLISVVEKIMLNILVDRLAKVYPLSREQGGFRKNEEATAQFLALAEIVRRRHLDGKDTFGTFIDFKKAYDRVQHGALFRILDHNGVRGKMLSFIKHIYRNNHIRVKMGGQLSESFLMDRGNRQGCPLSPLLYIIFIDGILKDCSAGGVEVPGTKTEFGGSGALPWINCPPEVCPGLIYADDVLALESSAPRTQTFLERLEAWKTEWDAEIGIKKCGVMCWSNKPEVRAEHLETTYTCGKDEIPKVERYQYLGIWVDHRLIESRGNEQCRSGTLEREFAKSQAAKGNRALYALRPFLEDRHVPIVLKAHAIRNLIQSKMLYGAEWIGFLNYNAEPLDKVLQRACGWVIGLRGSETGEADLLTLCYELNIPTCEEELHVRRARVVGKLQREGGGFKTWLQTLYEGKPPSSWRKKTWISGSMYWLSHAKKSLPKHSDAYTEDYEQWCLVRGLNPQNVSSAIDHGWNGTARFRNAKYPLREWATLEQTFALTVRSNPYESPLQRAMIEQRTMEDDAGNPVDIRPPIANKHMAIVAEQRVGEEGRDEFLSLVRIPKGRTSEEVTQLRTIRDVVLERQLSRNKSAMFSIYNSHEYGVTRGYLRNAVSRPDLSEGTRWITLIRTGTFPEIRELRKRAAAKGYTPTVEEGICPLCSEPVSATMWTHLLLSCKHGGVIYQRKHLLTLPFRLIRQGSSWDKIARAYTEDGTEVVNERILESVLGGAFVGGWIHVGKHTVPQYSLGFGQLDVTPEGLETYGWAFVAEFLQKVVPLYIRFFGTKVYTAGVTVLVPEDIQPQAGLKRMDIDDVEIEDPDVEVEMGGLTTLVSEPRRPFRFIDW